MEKLSGLLLGLELNGPVLVAARETQTMDIMGQALACTLGDCGQKIAPETVATITTPRGAFQVLLKSHGGQISAVMSADALVSEAFAKAH